MSEMYNPLQYENYGTQMANPIDLATVKANSIPPNLLSSLQSWGSSLMPSFAKDWTMTPTKNAQGISSGGQWGTLLGAAQGIGNLYLGMQQFGLAKDQLNFSKESWTKNYEANKGITNSQLADRQHARVASNPGAYQSVGEYMNKYGVK